MCRLVYNTTNDYLSNIIKKQQNETIMTNRITFKHENTIQVFRKGKTSNAKISNGTKQILQSYTFSINQFDYIKSHLDNNTKPVFKEFFSLDSANCKDCPFSMSFGSGGCYTHKVMQYSGFVSMLKSIANEFKTLDNIPNYSYSVSIEILKLAAKVDYIRFGTYGEPSLHPIELIESATSLVSSWTGYTHQWLKASNEYSKFFMASVHNESGKDMAAKFGYRSFIATKDENIFNVSCPASKESGFKSNCESCGLCSGTSGKGKKSIHILEH